MITILWTIYLCILLGITVDLLGNIFTKNYISQIWLIILKSNLDLKTKYHILIVSLMWAIWYMYFLH